MKMASGFDRPTPVAMRANPALFNVRFNGVLVAESVTREVAQKYLDERRFAGKGFCQVYLADRPIEARRSPAHLAHLPKRLSLKVSDAEREKLRAKFLTDGTLTEEPEHLCGCCGEECPSGEDCCSDDFPEPGDVREAS